MTSISLVLLAAAQLQGTPSLSDLLGSTCAPGANCSSTQSGGVSIGTLVQGPPRQPDGLYQGYDKVGRVAGAVINEKEKSIRFQALSFDKEIDPSKPIELQGLLLSCPDAPVAQPNVFVGEHHSMIMGGICKVIGHR